MMSLCVMTVALSNQRTWGQTLPGCFSLLGEFGTRLRLSLCRQLGTGVSVRPLQRASKLQPRWTEPSLSLRSVVLSLGPRNSSFSIGYTLIQ